MADKMSDIFYRWWNKEFHSNEFNGYDRNPRKVWEHHGWNIFIKDNKNEYVNPNELLYNNKTSHSVFRLILSMKYIEFLCQYFLKRFLLYAIMHCVFI